MTLGGSERGIYAASPSDFSSDGVQHGRSIWVQ